MEVLTDAEVRFLAATIAERLHEGVTRNAILEDIAEVCGREWAERFLTEVEQETRDCPGPPRGRVELRARARSRLRLALIPTLLGTLAALSSLLLTGEARPIALIAGGGAILYGVRLLLPACWLLWWASR